MKKSIPKIREREGNEKNPFPKFGNGKGMKKIHSRNSGRESEAAILGNDREREFPLTPDKELYFTTEVTKHSKIEFSSSGTSLTERHRKRKVSWFGFAACPASPI